MKKYTLVELQTDCSSWTAAATIRLHNQRNPAQAFRNHLRDAHLQFAVGRRPPRMANTGAFH